MARHLRFRSMALVLTAVAGWLPEPAGASGNILPNAYAWSENAGWINFTPNTGPGVSVGDSSVSGYAWSENFGWISFAPIAGDRSTTKTGNGAAVNDHVYGAAMAWPFTSTTPAMVAV